MAGEYDAEKYHIPGVQSGSKVVSFRIPVDMFLKLDAMGLDIAEYSKKKVLELSELVETPEFLQLYNESTKLDEEIRKTLKKQEQVNTMMSNLLRKRTGSGL